MDFLDKKKRQLQLNDILNKFYENPVARVSIELFLSIFTVIFFAVFAIRPTLLTIADLIKEIEDKEDLIVQLDRKIASLSSAETEYRKFYYQLGLLDEAIPKHSGILEAYS